MITHLIYYEHIYDIINFLVTFSTTCKMIFPLIKAQNTYYIILHAIDNGVALLMQERLNFI